LILYQVTSRPDEVNCNVYETLTLTMDQDTEITRKLLAHKKKNTCESFKNKFKLF